MYNYGSFCNGLLGIGRFTYGGIIMGIVGLLLIGAFIFFIMKNKNEVKLKNFESPLDLLQKRYINGEIDQEEYLEKVKILT